MLYYLSRILIFTLILTAPLSFAGDNCPDFKPNCEIKELLRNKAASVIVQQRSATSLISKQDASHPIEKTLDQDSSYPFHPTTASLLCPLHERAPPLTSPA